MMKEVIIVGAGIAGLTAGVYARQSGFSVTVYEVHTIPGGASTSWMRNGYFFEGGMHWLTGSSPKTALFKLWHETGALHEDTPIHIRDPFTVYETGGKRIILFRDVAKFKSHLLELSPEDEKEINSLCKDILNFSKLEKPLSDVKGVKVKHKVSPGVTSMLHALPALKRMSFYAGQTAHEYAMRFKSPYLQKFFLNMIGEDSNAAGLIFVLSSLCSGDGGYPQGGSIAMANRIAQKLMSLGGAIHYQTAIDKIIVKDGKATGVLINHQEKYADAVIVTQDTLVAVDSLFLNPIEEPWVAKMKKETIPMMNTYICLGIKANLSDIPENYGFELDSPISCGNIKVNSISINNYATYDKYAPKECTAVTCSIIGDNYEWWKIQKNSGNYEKEKKRLAEAVIEALTDKLPQIKNKVETWDIATPLTYERYLRSYKGSWMTVMGTDTSVEGYPSKPESISNLYFAGQRISPPGGLPVAVETARRAVQYLCLDTNTVFQGEL